MKKNAKLILEDGTTLSGYSFASPASTSGEVVFNTGMVGYPESFTDPSYSGQILTLTYPLIGNYGVPGPAQEGGLNKFFESDRIHISGLVVSEVSFQSNHWSSRTTLQKWLIDNDIPAMYDIDTRQLTKKLRERGTMLGKLICSGSEPGFVDPNQLNLVDRVSSTERRIYRSGGKRVLLIDCGCKNNIIRSLLRRDLTVIRVPWNYDFLAEDFNGILISNGPGDPKMARAAIFNIRKAMDRRVPIFGICLGNQILALAAGANTYKLKFGHRSQNQPCIEEGSKRCYITSQNHGFAVDTGTLPQDWKPWFSNANDGTNEGIRHRTKPFMSVQFHPEASPGPVDTGFLFDLFADML